MGHQGQRAKNQGSIKDEPKGEHHTSELIKIEVRINKNSEPIRQEVKSTQVEGRKGVQHERKEFVYLNKKTSDK